MPYLRPPPRAIPLSTGLVLLFGGQYSWLGWLFLSFGVVFGFIFGGNADLTSAFVFRGVLESAQGRIVSSEKTHFSEGGSKGRSGTPIYAHDYKFYYNDSEYSGTSYCRGGGLRNGESVTIEFPAGHPERSRIKNMRRAPFGMGTGIVLLFPIVALIGVVAGLRKGLNNIRLLTNGELTEGKLISKEPTNVRVNNQTVYKLTFSFKDSRGELRQAIAKTNSPEKLEDDAQERIFFDPENPQRSVLFDNLPGKQTFTNDGELGPCGFWRGLGIIFLPTLALLTAAGFLIARFHVK